MVILEKTKKKLIIPSGLGNKAAGGSIDPEIVEEIVDSAITGYDTTVVEPKITALSGATSALTNDVNLLNQKVGELSATTSSLTEDITLLETTVGNHTTDIQDISGSTESLSAATVSIEQQVATLAASAATKDYVDSALTAYTPTENFATINGSAVTAGGNIVINGGDYKVVTSLPASAEIGQLFYLLDSQLTLSGVVWDASETTAATYDECYVGMAYNTSVSGHNVFISISNTSGEFYNGGISQLPTEALDNSGAVVKYNGIGNLNFYYKIDKERRLIYLWPNEESVTIVKQAHSPSSEYDIITATTSSLTVYDGAGTTYRYTSTGYVKADATTQKQYVLNEMTQQERLALYNELLPYSGIGAGTIESAFTPSNYAFYLRGDTGSFDWGDQFRGIIPMTLAFYSPGDYGGAFFFTGVAGGRYGNGRYGNGSILKVRYIIASDGSADYSYHWVDKPGIVAFGFGWSDYAPLKYDVTNQQFLQGPNETVINPSGATFGIAGNNDINAILANGGLAYFDDRNSYVTPKYEIIIKDNGTERKYQNPSIVREEIATKTVDGQNFSNKYTFVYNREDGGRFLIRMALGDDNNQYGTDFEYNAIN